MSHLDLRDHETISREFAVIHERLDALMLDVSALDAAVASLTTTVADAQAAFATLIAAADAGQPAVTAAAEAVSALDVGLRAAIPAPPVVVVAEPQQLDENGNPIPPPVA